MSSSYTGSANTGAFTITIPSDGDAGNAASVNTAFQKLADFFAGLYTRDFNSAGPPDTRWQGAHVFAQVVGLNAGATSSGGTGVAALTTTTQAAAGDPKLIAVHKVKVSGSTTYARCYADQDTRALRWTMNAAWDLANSRWQADVTADDRSSLEFGGAGLTRLLYSAGGGTGHWTSWDKGCAQQASVAADGSTGTLLVGGPVQITGAAASASAGAIEVLAGEVWSDSAPIGRAQCDGTSIARQQNVKSYSRTGTGDYEFIFYPVVGTPSKATYEVTCGAIGYNVSATVADAGGGDAGRIKATVHVRELQVPALNNPPGFNFAQQSLVQVASNQPFSLVVYY